MLNQIGILLICDGTPLHMAAYYDSDLVIPVLIKHNINIGTSIHTVDSKDHTALYIAWSRKNQKAVRVLEQYDTHAIEFYEREHRINTKKTLCGIIGCQIFLSMGAGFIVFMVAIFTGFFGTVCSAGYPNNCPSGTY